MPIVNIDFILKQAYLHFVLSSFIFEFFTVVYKPSMTVFTAKIHNVSDSVIVGSYSPEQSEVNSDHVHAWQ